MSAKPDVEISIARFCGEENTPIRISIAVVGDPSRRLLVDLSLADFALAVTGRGAVPGLVHKNTLETDPLLLRAAVDDAHKELDRYLQPRRISHRSLVERIREVLNAPPALKP